MQLLLLTAAGFVAFGLAENSTHFSRGKIRAAKILDVNSFIYRPYIYQYGRRKWNSTGLQPYIKYFPGDSEQSVRASYSHEIENATKQRMYLYKKGKFYRCISPAQKIQPNRWYGYTVQVYYRRQLVYEERLGVYHTPATIESCTVDDYMIYRLNTPCSELFLDPEDRRTTTTKYPDISPRNYPEPKDNLIGVKVGLGVFAGSIVMCIIVCVGVYHHCKPYLIAAVENESRREDEAEQTAIRNRNSSASTHNRNTASLHPVRGITTLRPDRVNTVSRPDRTTATAVSYASINEPPPSYYEVVSKENRHGRQTES